MSTYYSFYIGKQNKKTKEITIIGPKLENELHSFYSRSGSFIDWEEIQENMDRISPDIITKESWQALGYHSDDDYKPTTYILSINHATNYATGGLVKGYVTIEELNYLANNNFNEDAIEDVCIYKPEVIAEIKNSKRDEYVMFAAISTRTFGYICQIALELIEPLRYHKDKEVYDYIIICVVE